MLKKILLTFVLGLSTITAFAQGDRAERIEQQLTELKQRLELSDTQSEQIRSILEQSVEERRSILQRYGIDMENKDPDTRKKLSFREKRKLGGELREAKKETMAQLDKLLSTAQMEEYHAMQKERKEKRREHLNSRR